MATVQDLYTNLVSCWPLNETSGSLDYDEIAIWSRVLNSGDVTQLYNSGNGLSYADVTGGTTDNSSFFAVF